MSQRSQFLKVNRHVQKEQITEESARRVDSIEQIMDQKKEIEDSLKIREEVEDIDPREITRQVLKTCNILRERNATVLPTRPHLREIRNHYQVQEMKALFNNTKAPSRQVNSSFGQNAESFQLPKGGFEPDSPSVISTTRGINAVSPLKIKLNF